LSFFVICTTAIANALLYYFFKKIYQNLENNFLKKYEKIFFKNCIDERNINISFLKKYYFRLNL
jgi:hypothetical protein